MCLPSFPPSAYSRGEVRFTPRVASTSFRESYSSTHPEAGRPSKNRKNYSSKSKQTEEEEGKPALTREKRRGENKVFFSQTPAPRTGVVPPGPSFSSSSSAAAARAPNLSEKEAGGFAHTLPPLPSLANFLAALSPLSLPTELQCLDR